MARTTTIASKRNSRLSTTCCTAITTMGLLLVARSSRVPFSHGFVAQPSRNGRPSSSSWTTTSTSSRRPISSTTSSIATTVPAALAVAPISSSTTVTSLNSFFTDFASVVPDLSTHLPFVLDPLLLKHMATGGALAFMGDMIAQTLASRSARKEAENTADTDTKDTDADVNVNVLTQVLALDNWDQRRTAALSVFGCLYTGGVQHFIFGYLNTSFDDPLMRLALAQFAFIPLCYYPAFLLTVPALRAGFRPGSDVERNKLTQDLLGKLPVTLLRNWAFWLPVQFVQFSFIPTEMQVTYCASFGVIWNAILSYSTMQAGASATEEDTKTLKDKQQQLVVEMATPSDSPPLSVTILDSSDILTKVTETTAPNTSTRAMNKEQEEVSIGTFRVMKAQKTFVNEKN